MKRSKNYSMMMSLVFVFVFCISNAWAANLSVNLTVQDASGAPGGSVTVPIVIDDATDLLSGDITLGYDRDILTPTGAETTDLTSDFMIAHSIYSGHVSIALATASALDSGSRALINVHFSISDDPTDYSTNITISKATLYNARYQLMEITTTDGIITIPAPTPTPVVTPTPTPSPTPTPLGGEPSTILEPSTGQTHTGEDITSSPPEPGMTPATGQEVADIGGTPPGEGKLGLVSTTQLWVLYNGAWTKDPAAIYYDDWTYMLLYNDHNQWITIYEVELSGRQDCNPLGHREAGYYYHQFDAEKVGWNRIYADGRATGQSNEIWIYVWPTSPTPTPTPASTVEFDFDDGQAQNWIDDGSGCWSISDGVYAMTGNNGEANRYSHYDQELCDFTYQADMRKVSGDRSGHFMSFGQSYSYGTHIHTAPFSFFK